METVNKKFKLTVYISDDNAKRLGHLAVDSNRSRSDIMDDLMSEYFWRLAKKPTLLEGMGENA